MELGDDRPSILANEEFDKDADAQVLRQSCKGMGTDEEAILNVLCYRTAIERIQIARHYKAAYGRDLIEDLKSELSGDFESVIVGLITPPALYDAKQLRKAISGLGTDEDVLLEIMCARTNLQMENIRIAYRLAKFGDGLEEDIENDTSGDLKRFLVGLSVGARDEDQEIYEDRIEADVNALVEAGEGRWGTDESEFQRIFVARSYRHVRGVLVAYAASQGKTVTETIKDELSGNLEQGYRNIVEFIRNPHEYFADKLYKAMKGLGTDEDCLARIMVTRADIDLGSIADTFEAKYEQSLAQFIEDDVSGDFKRALVALIS